MLRNYVRTRQPNFVMPPNPTQASADRKICALPRRNAPSLPPSQFPVVHPQCNSFVSYGPATTMLLMQLLPDTNLSFSATNRVARPYLRCNRHRPTSGRIRHDEIRQFIRLLQCPAIQHPFDTCVSYASATTTLQIRHLPDTNHLAPDTKSVEMSNVLLSGPTTPTRPTFPPATTTKSANPVPSAQTAPVRLIRQLRPRYNYATNATPFRYEENRSSYEERRTPLSGLRPSPTKDFPPCHDEIRQLKPRLGNLPAMELLGPIRASYGSGTNGTPLRYKSLVHSYKPSSTPYLSWYRPPPKCPPHLSPSSRPFLTLH